MHEYRNRAFKNEMDKKEQPEDLSNPNPEKIKTEITPPNPYNYEVHPTLRISFKKSVGKDKKSQQTENFVKNKNSNSNDNIQSVGSILQNLGKNLQCTEAEQSA